MSITKEENSAFVAGDAFPEAPITMPEKPGIGDEKSQLNQRPAHTTGGFCAASAVYGYDAETV